MEQQTLTMVSSNMVNKYLPELLLERLVVTQAKKNVLLLVVSLVVTRVTNGHL